MNELTYGQKAVGLTFNPSGDRKVNDLKTLYATVIDILDAMRSDDQGQNRLIAIAITEAQAAQMWAVKAVTWRD